MRPPGNVQSRAEMGGRGGRPLEHTRREVNMDNYYTIPRVLVLLQQRGICGRGMMHKSQKMFSHCVHCSPAEVRQLPCGSKNNVGFN